MSDDELDALLAEPRVAMSADVARLRAWLVKEADRVEGLARVVPANGWLARIETRDGELVVTMPHERLEEVLGAPVDCESTIGRAWKTTPVETGPATARFDAHVPCAVLRRGHFTFSK